MYTLNNIAFKDYGIIPGRVPGESLAFKGCFDAPKRIGDTHYNWAEFDGIEPYLDVAGVFYGGRTIYFQGVITGTRPDVLELINTFKSDVEKYTAPVPLILWETYCVNLVKLTPTFFKGGATVLIEFREPVIGATCGIIDTNIPPVIYESEVYTETAQKNNCDSGYYGSDVSLTAAAGKFTSTQSQAAANLLAVQWVRESKQDYANVHGTCIINPPVYYNTKLTGTLQKNDCENGELGTILDYTVPAFTYSSLVSQDAANALAQAELDANLTQDYVNENGSCIIQYWNNEIVFERQKNSCPSGYVGETLSITIPANVYSSEISQENADFLAVTAAQLELDQNTANTIGKCITLSTITLGRIAYYTRIQTRGVHKFFEITTPINVGDTFTFLVYGVKASYTVVAGDGIIDVIKKWANIVNGMSKTNWDAENMYPNRGDEIWKPQAHKHLNSNYLRIEFRMALSAGFKVYIE